MQEIGIVRAEQYSDELLAGPAVVFRHGADWQRLDHFISGNPGPPDSGSAAPRRARPARTSSGPTGRNARPLRIKRC
jgi:hypothetical protein